MDDMRNKSLKTNKEFPILKPETSEDEDSVPSGIITPTTIHLETDDSESNEINSSDDSNDHHLGHQVMSNFTEVPKNLSCKENMNNWENQKAKNAWNYLFSEL